MLNKLYFECISLTQNDFCFENLLQSIDFAQLEKNDVASSHISLSLKNITIEEMIISRETNIKVFIEFHKWVSNIATLFRNLPQNKVFFSSSYIKCCISS